MRQAKTHCKRGHALTEENRYKGTKECNQCRRDRARLFHSGETLPDTKKIFRWSPANLQILITMYTDYSNTDIAKIIGGNCNKSNVQRKGLRMGLKKITRFYGKSRPVATERCTTEEYNPMMRITYPKPGVTVHRCM